MRYRDALKSPQRCEAELIGNGDVTPEETNEWEFIRETRRRLIRTEERVAILMKVVVTGFIALWLTVLGGLILQLILS